MNREEKIIKQNRIVTRAAILFHAGKPLTAEQRAIVDRKTIFEKICGKITIDNRTPLYFRQSATWTLAD